jgi:hypothetical protein
VTYEEHRVVQTEPEAVDAVPADTEVVQEKPATVVERRPAASRTVVTSDDPVGSAYAASQLIGTIVWSIVVLVLLVVALLALHVYAHLF